MSGRFLEFASDRNRRFVKDERIRLREQIVKIVVDESVPVHGKPMIPRHLRCRFQAHSRSRHAKFFRRLPNRNSSFGIFGFRYTEHLITDAKTQVVTPFDLLDRMRKRNTQFAHCVDRY
ncbi:MAG: hypothetical protein C4324_04305 [Blastocatellia bacterium]